MYPVTINKTLLFVALFFIDQNNSEIGRCPYGWKLSSDRQKCILPCSIRKHSIVNPLNSYCDSVVLAGINLQFNSSDRTYSIPIGKSLLNEQYNLTPKHRNSQPTRPETIIIRKKSTSFKLLQSNRKRVLRVLSSPQFLQCEITTTVFEKYYLAASAAGRDRGVRAVIPERNTSAYLGDFSIDGKYSLLTCAQNIILNQFNLEEQQLIPRCNYITVRSEDYTLHPNGSMSLLKNGFLIKIPIYSLIIEDYYTLVCVPLAIRFLNCANKQLLDPNDYLFNRAQQLIGSNGKNVDIDWYYFSANGYAVCCQCQTDPIVKLKKFQSIFYAALDYLSTLCLFLVLIFRFKIFMQNNHTRCMLFHLLCLIISNISSSVNPSQFPATSSFLPILVFCLTHYFFLSGMLWLNAIAFDSWLYFKRRLSINRRRTSCSTGAKNNFLTSTKFVAYNAYSWGISSVYLIFMFYLEYVSQRCRVTFGLCPHFRFKGSFNNQDAYLLYFCLPTNICTLINLVFLGLIVRIVYRAGVGTELVNNQRIKQIVRWSMKLFILTGCCYTIILLGSVLMAIRVQLYITFLTLNNLVLNCQGIVIFLTYYSTADLLSFVRNCRARISTHCS